MSNRPLDAVDRQILGMLSANARSSASAMARTVGLSRGAVHQRVARLERDGVIAGYTTLLYQSEVMTGETVTALLMINLDTPRYAEVASVLTGWPEIRACWSTAGERDMALVVDVRSNAELMDMTRRLNELSAVRDTATHVALRTHFNRFGIPVT